MIKIKITKQGGYVVGDGPCPFDPDEFMAMFMDRIVEARREGLQEIGIPDHVIDQMKQEAIDELATAPVIEIKQSKKVEINKQRILAALDIAMPPAVPQLEAPHAAG
jgi:hypothetical protein